MSPKSSGAKLLSLITSLVVSFVLIGAAVWAVVDRQQILDQINVWQYQPSAEIASFATRSGMNGEGRFLFYASLPKLDGTSTFNNECDRVEATTAILGCYTGNRIYIYDVTSATVDGVREVTAAHEMLHAAYARLSDSERASVDKLLEAEYKNLSSDKDFSDLVAFYAKSEPGQRDNELHSIIGTTVANLDPALEAHYGRYFSNRADVVALNAKYQSVFNKNKAEADTLLAQYTSLGTKISSELAQYNQSVQSLNADISSFNDKAKSGGFQSTAQFNAERSALVSRINTLNATHQAIASDIQRYQAIYNQYNQIATESKKLYSLLDSSLAPAPSL